jgi:hypothetical protein
MVTRKYKSLDNPKGVGEVYKGDEKLAKVRYKLNVQQEVLTTRAFNGAQDVKGMQSGTGSIDVLEGKINLLDRGEKLTLHMEDGKKVDFSITGDVNTGRFLIKLSGGFY